MRRKRLNRERIQNSFFPTFIWFFFAVRIQRIEAMQVKKFYCSWKWIHEKMPQEHCLLLSYYRSANYNPDLKIYMVYTICSVSFRLWKQSKIKILENRKWCKWDLYVEIIISVCVHSYRFPNIYQNPFIYLIFFSIQIVHW